MSGPDVGREGEVAALPVPGPGNLVAGPPLLLDAVAVAGAAAAVVQHHPRPLVPGLAAPAPAAAAQRGLEGPEYSGHPPAMYVKYHQCILLSFFLSASLHSMVNVVTARSLLGVDWARVGGQLSRVETVATLCTTHLTLGELATAHTRDSYTIAGTTNLLIGISHFLIKANI